VLREIRTQPWSIFSDVSVDGLLIACLVSNPVPVLSGACKRSPHESTGIEELDDVPTHVILVRANEIRTHERIDLVSNHYLRP